MKEVRMRGGIKSQGKGSWVAVIPLGRDPVTGKYRQKWVTVKGTRKEAEAKRRDLLQRKDEGRLVSSSKITLSDYLLGEDGDRMTGWLADRASAKHLSPRTVQSYREDIVKHIVPGLGSVRLTDLKPVTIDKFLTQKQQAGRLDGQGGLSGTSVGRLQVIFHCALKQAVKWEMLLRNPCEGLDHRKSKAAERRALTIPEMIHLLDTVKAEMPEYFALFSLALYAGLRRGELLGLT